MEKKPNPVTHPIGHAEFGGGPSVHTLSLNKVGTGYPFPTEFPAEELGVLASSLLQGHGTSHAELAHAAWVISGYAIGQGFSNPDANKEHPLMAQRDCPTTPEATHALLGEVIHNKVMPPWIAPLILNVLETVLKNLLQ